MISPYVLNVAYDQPMSIIIDGLFENCFHNVFNVVELWVCYANKINYLEQVLLIVKNSWNSLLREFFIMLPRKMVKDRAANRA